LSDHVSVTVSESESLMIIVHFLPWQQNSRLLLMGVILAAESGRRIMPPASGEPNGMAQSLIKLLLVLVVQQQFLCKLCLIFPFTCKYLATLVAHKAHARPSGKVVYGFRKGLFRNFSLSFSFFLFLSLSLSLYISLSLFLSFSL
jgi:hypothetical protein